MNYEQLNKINEKLKTIDVKNKKYVEVNQRVLAFRELYPEGSVATEILSMDNGVVIMKAVVCDEGGKVLSTGMAYEKEGSTFINKTSYIENCETSAVGRALGFLGIGIDGSIASYEEVENAKMQQQDKVGEQIAKAKEENSKKTARDKVVEYAKEKGLDMNELAKDYKLNCNTTEEEFEKVLKHLKGEE